MKTFKTFFLEDYRRIFKKRKDITPIYDSLWFKFYIDNSIKLNKSQKKDILDKSQQISKETFNHLSKIGFSKEKRNVILKDFSKTKNVITGEIGGTAGNAMLFEGYIHIDINQILNNSVDLIYPILVHEWAHLWMQNKSKALKSDIEDLYNLFVEYSKESKDIKSIKFLDIIKNPKQVYDLYNNEAIETYKKYIQIALNQIFQNRDLDSEEVIKELIKKFGEIKSPKSDIFIKNKNFIESMITYLNNQKRLYTSINFEPLALGIAYLIFKHKSAYYLSRNRLSTPKSEFARDEANKLVRWISSYGMADPLELWATAIQYFDELPSDHKKRIVEIIQRNK
jgi:hypothetical protein